MKYSAHPDVVWTVNTDEVTIYHAELGEFKSLNKSGSAIWVLLTDEHRHAEEIPLHLAHQFAPPEGQDASVIANEVGEFVALLVDSGFVLPERSDS